MTKLPNKVGIGGALDREVNNTTNKALKQAGMPDSVAINELVDFNSVIQRNSPLQVEKRSRVNNRGRKQ